MLGNILREGLRSLSIAYRFCMLWLAGGIAAAYGQIAFEDATTEAGFPSTGTESWGAAWGDVDSDYFPDVFSTNHRTRGSLFRNNQDGTFSDVSQQVDSSATPGWTGGRADVDTHGATWGDVDNDGDDDLYLSVSSNSDHLLINEDGVLVDRSAAWEVDRLGHDNARMSLFLDYTGDGLLDIMAASLIDPRMYPQQDDNIRGNTSDNNFGYSSIYYESLDCNDDASFAHMGDVDANSDGIELLCAPRNGVYPENIYSWDSGVVTDISGSFPTNSGVNDAIIADFDGDLRPDVFEVIASSRPAGVIQVGARQLETQLINSATNVKSAYFTTTGLITISADLRAGEPAEGDERFINIGASGYSPGSLTFTLDPADPSNYGIRTDSEGVNIGFDSSTNTWQIRQNGGAYNYSYLIVDSTENITNTIFEGATGADRPAQNKLLMNRPSGWTDETVARGLGGEVLCVTGVAGDFDNDMDQDIYLGCTGGPNNIANVMYENQGDGTFIALPNGAGAAGYVGAAVLENAGTTESAITADYDLDGFLDIFVTNGNNLRPTGHGGPKQLFRNLGNENNWIELDLIGVQDNRDAIGATILVTAGGVTQYLEQNGKYHRWSQSHKRMHVGLAANATADITIQWPNGDVDNHTGVAANRLYSATQNGAIEIIPAFGPSPDGDEDNDGLSNAREAELSTDPFDADTDDDNLSDGVEVNDLQTNPLSVDTDGDTMDDFWEVVQRTDPLRKSGAQDPDGDNLTNRQEYKYRTNPNQVDTDGDKLRDNVEVRKTFTDPRNRDTDGDGLNDRREVKFLGTDPLSVDSDGDSMTDKWEVQFKLNPLRRDGGKDKDNDGLTNRREFNRDTDPNDPDTDGGGTIDGDELRNGTNPLVASDD